MKIYACFPFLSVATNMSENKDRADDAFVATVKKLGAGYRGRRAFPRCSIREPDDESVDPAPAAYPGDVDGANAIAVAELPRRYPYRRPVPLPDDDDLVEPDANRDSAALELETGFTAAANVLPPNGGDVGGAGADGGDGGADGDGDGDGGDGGADDRGDDDLFTAHSSSSSSFDTAEAVNFAMDWDDEDGCGGQQQKAEELASSSDPAKFQDARESSRSLLTMAAFFGRTADGMFQEHRRARQEADMYMSEVSVATGTLEISVKVYFIYAPTFSTGN